MSPQTAANTVTMTAVHIVGLTCATLITLVVLPVFYLIFCEKLKWIK